MQELSVDVRKQKLQQSQNDYKRTEEQLESTDNRLKGLFLSVVGIQYNVVINIVYYLLITSILRLSFILKLINNHPSLAVSMSTDCGSLFFFQPTFVIFQEKFFAELDQEIVALEREQTNFSTKVEEYRNKEREWREKISEDSRELEKATNKQV